MSKFKDLYSDTFGDISYGKCVTLFEITAKRIRQEIGWGFHTDFFFMPMLMDLALKAAISRGSEDSARYMEIGCFNGVSSSFMAACHNPIDIVAIDLGSPVAPQVAKDNVNKYLSSLSTFRYIQANSHQPSTLNTVKRIMPKCHILFIDGDHTPAGVIKDFEMYSSLVEPGGFVVFDDYNDFKFSPGVKVGVNRIIASLDCSWQSLHCIPTENNNCLTLRKRNV